MNVLILLGFMLASNGVNQDSKKEIVQFIAVLYGEDQIDTRDELPALWNGLRSRSEDIQTIKCHIDYEKWIPAQRHNLKDGRKTPSTDLALHEESDIKIDYNSGRISIIRKGHKLDHSSTLFVSNIDYVIGDGAKYYRSEDNKDVQKAGGKKAFVESTSGAMFLHDKELPVFLSLKPYIGEFPSSLNDKSIGDKQILDRAKVESADSDSIIVAFDRTNQNSNPTRAWVSKPLGEKSRITRWQTFRGDKIFRDITINYKQTANKIIPESGSIYLYSRGDTSKPDYLISYKITELVINSEIPSSEFRMDMKDGDIIVRQDTSKEMSERVSFDKIKSVGKAWNPSVDNNSDSSNAFSWTWIIILVLVLCSIIWVVGLLLWRKMAK